MFDAIELAKQDVIVAGGLIIGIYVAYLAYWKIRYMLINREADRDQQYWDSNR